MRIKQLHPRKWVLIFACIVAISFTFSNESIAVPSTGRTAVDILDHSVNLSGYQAGTEVCKKSNSDNVVIGNAQTCGDAKAFERDKQPKAKIVTPEDAKKPPNKQSSEVIIE